MATNVLPRVTPQEYLLREQQSEMKSEYVDGEVRPMGGAKPEHVLIVSNIIVELSRVLDRSKFQIFGSDLKVHTGSGSYRYPDVSVVPTPFALQPGTTDVITNPLVICEVLSSSTEAVDRGEKFADYRTIETLQTYVLVSQNRSMIECYNSQPDGTWVYTDFSEGDVSIPCLDGALHIERIYSNIEFE